ncbi:Riboflavin synthase [BD1-7 clade bacterium]|uniref:Riboflavin synthase n=1 Tax=BD1-7 clade bacterium TaxID=2029982 RepID=A0A5S9QLV4_9GAMM|nr:Riboflavin synthase [BD1-7 clade bacterium]
MFTGIVQSACTVARIDQKTGLNRYYIDIPHAYRSGIENGASIAIDGVCLTVTGYNASNLTVEFDAMQETLALTTIGTLSENDSVNIERSATLEKELGGHMVSGHVDGTCEVVNIETTENNCTVSYRYSPAFDKYLFQKGFVALNGCSLTIAAINHEKHELSVCYIPETLDITTHGSKKVGDKVNIEIDRQTQAVVDTVERVLAARETS